ncbi:G patch domain-containing protein TGH homolog [Phragmites australis]|uniref:G patch domain-containing protein TGH homolog n=1 Tax=Phragmites australis TaxID=29695 RepID=UPI002D77D97F|nr:G patch domain-containing protein TGH homolog [Phragmites australis]XP_062228743.1 G patch domain-containing protein TGH homolog [Phragmites australis]
MAGDSDDEDLVVYGTPIEREEDTSARKRRAVAESGQLRALPAWKQEVRDEEGRRRFHGAFTGGFSAGFYNTAGSKEGWTPQTFTSSRKNRAEVKKQSIHSFLDEDDVKDMGGNALETSQQYDTFGFTAAEYARKQASKEQKERPLAIPGPIPDELVVPTTNSIGVKLLTKMGWRQGRSIRDSHSDSLYESRRNARKAFIALSGVKNDEGEDQIDSDKPSLDQTVVGSFEEMRASRNTPVYVLHPKQDLHGLGYDPFKHAPEFRDRKKLQKSRDRDHKRNNVLTRGSLLISNSGHYAPGFGIGALEELDVEDEDIYASGFAYEQTEVDIEPSKTGDGNYKLDNRKRGVFLSFKIATNSDYKLERFHPPEIPVDFDGRHKFPTPVQPAEKFSDSAPPEVPPPEDTSLALLIEGCAAMVARCGKHIEDFYKKKSKTNPQFLFLSGGDGCNCYTRKLWEHQQKYIGQRRPVVAKSKPPSDKLTAENRGKILGERPLDRSTKLHSSSLSAREAVQLQSNLVDTFVKPISLDGLPESEKPFRNDPAKQARFEQFLRDKYQGGLRAANVTHISTMSDADRARERLDFEAAATAIEKGKEKKVIDPSSVLWLPGMNEQRFISATQLEGSVVPQDEKPIYPRREQFEWRPSPILCKRFDVVDPFMGKPMPIQRPRSKIDNLILMTESTKGTKDEVESSSRSSQHASVARITEAGSQGTANDPDIEHSSMQRHVDLYKAIFSDDSDDDTEEILNNQPVDPVKTSEGANMALNRLVAEDFLESLGKELGLEVPPERPDVLFRSETLSAAGASVSSKNEKITSVCTEVKENQSSLGMAEVGKANADAPLASAEKIYLRYEKQEHRTEESRSHPSHRQSKNCSPDSDSSSERHRSRNRRSHHYIRSGTPESDSSSERHRSRRRKSHSRHRKGRSRTPDADSPSATQHDDRKRQKKRHHRTYTPDTDSSDHEYKERFKSSKDRSRKHSRHHKHGRKDHAE